MANVNSTQYAATQIPPIAKMSPADMGGRLKRAYFTYNQGASAGAIGDVIYCCKLPSGANVLGSRVFYSAHGGSATLALGIVGTPAKFLAATSTVSAGNAEGLAHLASGAQYKLTADTDVIATNAGSAIPANGVVTGWVDYLLD